MNNQCGECVRGLTPNKEVCEACGGTALVKELVNVETPKEEVLSTHTIVPKAPKKK